MADSSVPAENQEDPQQALEKTFSLAIKLQREFNDAQRAPAPARSLHTPQSEIIGQILFKDANTVFFGEIHDDANYKFLADNPAFFKAAKDKGAENIFVELPVHLYPAFKSYSSGKLSEQDLLSNIGITPASGENYYVFAQQVVAFAKTAKENGINVIPSDFRWMEGMTSDAFGVPDIERKNDSARKITLDALREYKETYGRAIPVTREEIGDLSRIHTRLINELSPDELTKFKNDTAARGGDDNDFEKVHFQNVMQARLYSTTIKPGEKSLFFGGARHFDETGSMPNILEDNGYGRVAGIRLESNAALIQNKLNIEFARAAKGATVELPHELKERLKFQEDIEKTATNKFDYILHTETGDAFDHNGKQLPAPVATPAPAPDRQRQQILEPIS